MRYGELYAGLRTDSKWSLSHNLVFLVRRMSFLALAFHGNSTPVLQIQVLCLSHLLYTIYIGLKNKRVNKLLHF